MAATVTEHIANRTGCVNDASLLDCLRDIPAFELQDVRKLGPFLL